MYAVHMKQVTATEARRTWFRLLDEVAEGEVVVLERKGRRIVLRQEEAGRRRGQALPDYGAVLTAADVEHADEWTWEWQGPGPLGPVAAIRK